MLRTLRRGTNGPEVRDAQERINWWTPPYGPKLTIDGVFGPATEKAVRDYQEGHGLDVDGVIGSNTWGSLYMRMQLFRGYVKREMPIAVKSASAGDANNLFGQVIPVQQQQPAQPVPQTGSTVLQLQPSIQANMPPWIFPPGQQPGTILQRNLLLTLVYKTSDGQGHLEAGPFLQASSNSQNGPSDPKVSFAAGYQVVAADLLAPWNLPKLKGWVLHPLAIAWQNQVVFNAKPYSTVLGLSMGLQSQLDCGSDRFGVQFQASVAANADLTHNVFQLGPQGVLVGVVQF
jgi:hypothetical protein